MDEILAWLIVLPIAIIGGLASFGPFILVIYVVLKWLFGGK